MDSLTHFLLLDENLLNSVSDIPETVKTALKQVSGGKSGDFLNEVLFLESSTTVLQQYPEKPLEIVLRQYVESFALELKSSSLGPQWGEIYFQVVGVALIQGFIQVNFTGPAMEFNQAKFFPDIDVNLVQLEANKLLALEGQSVYDLMVDPVLLVVSSLIFEAIMGLNPETSLVHCEPFVQMESIIEATQKYCNTNINNKVGASAMWWRSRVLQVHLSVFSEPISIISSISSLLLTTDVVKTMECSVAQTQRQLYTLYLVETARIGLHSHTEQLSIPSLTKASEVSGLEMILSGAKAKRTKHQTFNTPSLLVLAKSKYLDDGAKLTNNPERFQLDSDILLEKPEYEALEDEIPESSKRIRLEIDDEDTVSKLLPMALRQEDIPRELRTIDPNSQPQLSDLDNIQLLLRLSTLKQTSPSNNPLVEEQLSALVDRIVHGAHDNINWSVFSRALWEKSNLETTKARTVERGILQMTSIIEEIGIKIKTRIIAGSGEGGDSGNEAEIAANRLKYIHQLPLLPQWTMDMRLAEKYMALGVLRSAIDIYDRLQLSHEAALCYAALGEEHKAEEVITERIKVHPEDARAVSILGDIRQEPNLWERAWEIGRYAKAKASLSRFCYAPPAPLNRNVELAIKHMNDCLQINPLSYENWFFYGCCGLETGQFELAAEGFTRCVALDDNNSYAWSNLATALLQQDKTKPAFNALKKALTTSNEGAAKSWKIYENYLTVAMKLNEWNDVLIATRELVDMNKGGNSTVDIPVIEKLVEILVATEFTERLTHYQRSCCELVCEMVPGVVNSARCWRLVARVELWRKRLWAALESHEKAYRAATSEPELETSETVWNDAVATCEDLVAAYENLGDMPGRVGGVVCSDWKYKARSSIRSLMSKGKDMFEDSEGWDKLVDMKGEMSS